MGVLTPIIKALVQYLIQDQPPADNDRCVSYCALELRSSYRLLECVPPFVLFASRFGLDEWWAPTHVSPGLSDFHDSREPKDHSSRMHDSELQPIARAI